MHAALASILDAPFSSQKPRCVDFAPKIHCPKTAYGLWCNSYISIEVRCKRDTCIMPADTTGTGNENETTEQLEQKIGILTKAAHDMCVRATSQAEEMQKYVEMSTQLESLMSALDDSISGKGATKLGFSETMNRLIEEQPKHQALMRTMHLVLVNLQKKQHEISDESTQIAAELVNLNRKNQKAHTDANQELGKQVRHRVIAAKLMTAATKETRTKNVTVSNEFLKKVLVFVNHVDKMIHCKMEKETVFQVICKEIDSVRQGVNVFSEHLANPVANANDIAHISPPAVSHLQNMGTVSALKAPKKTGVNSSSLPPHPNP